MSEFVFKNLSMKLLPAEEGVAREADCKCCSFVVGCGDCTEVTCGPCTNTATCGGCTGPCTDRVTCGPCTNTVTCDGCTGPCTDRVTCGPCSNGCTDCTEAATRGCGGSCTCDQFTNPIITQFDAGTKPVGDIRAELAAHKERLRQGIAQVEEQERELDTRGKPQSVEEIDQLKAQLLEAIAELDEQRAQLGTGTEPGPG